MATFTKPAVNSPFSKLPAELATRILDFLFAGRSPDVAQCRLVCQDLYTLSSPYLIRTVVVAERLPALRKVREFMLHPYFSKHVTHLVWDASYYTESLATDYNAYEHAFEQSGHTASARDEAYIKIRAYDIALLKEVQGHVPMHPTIPASLRGTGRLLEYGIGPSTEDEQGMPLHSQWRHRPQQEDVISMPDIRSSKFYIDSADFQDSNHMRACHIGFSDYYRRWENQKKIRGEPRGTRGDQARNYLFEAIGRLPKLRHLAHSDYRALAYNGESYVHLCQRLFGHTVCPNWSLKDESDEDARETYKLRFQTFLQDLSRSRKVWDSLSIGCHPFETNYHDIDTYAPRNSGQANVGLSYGALLKPFAREGGTPLNLQVRSLKLAPLQGNRSIVTKLGGLSRLVTDRLTELELGDHTFYFHWNKFRRVNPGAFGNEHGGRPDHLFHGLLMTPESSDVMKNLRRLSLRGFSFDTTDLQTLLLDRSRALRLLHLIDCFCRDDYESFLQILQENQPVSKLSGIEIFDLRFTPLQSETADHKYAQEYRTKLQARRAHEYEWWRDGRNDYLEGLLLSDWPYERSELEAALLGGRVNMICRKMYAAPCDEARDSWQDMPNDQS